MNEILFVPKKVPDYKRRVKIKIKYSADGMGKAWKWLTFTWNTATFNEIRIAVRD